MVGGILASTCTQHLASCQGIIYSHLSDKLWFLKLISSYLSR